MHMGNHVLAEVVAPLLRGFDPKVCEKYLSSMSALYWNENTAEGSIMYACYNAFGI